MFRVSHAGWSLKNLKEDKERVKEVMRKNMCWAKGHMGREREEMK